MRDNYEHARFLANTCHRMAMFEGAPLEWLSRAIEIGRDYVARSPRATGLAHELGLFLSHYAAALRAKGEDAVADEASREAATLLEGRQPSEALGGAMVDLAFDPWAMT